MRKKELNFKEIYSSLVTEYPNITKLPKDHINEIQIQFEKEKVKDITNAYLIAILSASLTIILFPFVITRVYSSLDIVSLFLERNYDLIPNHIVNILNFSLGVGGISIIIYLFLFPSLFRPFKKRLHLSTSF